MNPLLKTLILCDLLIVLYYASGSIPTYAQLPLGWIGGAAYVSICHAIDIKGKRKKRECCSEYGLPETKSNPPMPPCKTLREDDDKEYSEYITAGSPILTVTHAPEPYQATNTAFCYVDKHLCLIDVATRQVQCFKPTIGMAYLVSYNRQRTKLSDCDLHKGDGYWIDADVCRVKPIKKIPTFPVSTSVNKIPPDYCGYHRCSANCNGQCCDIAARHALKGKLYNCPVSKTKGRAIWGWMGGQ